MKSSNIKTEYSPEQVITIPALADEITPGSLTQLTEGHFSQAFKFETRAGDKRVLRLGRKLYSFKADQFAHDHFASPDLPVPQVFEIGEAENSLFYCVSEFAAGTPSDQLSPEDFAKTGPDMDRAFAAIFNTDISHSSGEGDINTDTGNGGDASFIDFLKKERADEDHDELRRQCEDADIAPLLVDAAMHQFNDNIDKATYQRRLIHGDLGSDNVIVDGHKVSAVIDWSGMGYGDWLHDYSRIEFWYPGRPTPAPEFAERYHLETENFDERWLAYMAAHALATLQFAFKYDSQHTIDWLRSYLPDKLVNN